MTRFAFLLLALCVTATFAATLPESLLDDDEDDHKFHKPHHHAKPASTPCATHAFATAIPIPAKQTAPESSAAPVVDPLATPEPSIAPADPFVTPDSSAAPLDPMVTPEPSAAVVDPMAGIDALATPEASAAAVDPLVFPKSDTDPIDALVTPEPSAAVVDPMVAPKSDNVLVTPEPSAAAVDPMASPDSDDALSTPEPSVGPVDPIVTPAPSVSVFDTPRNFHVKPSPHAKVVHHTTKAHVAHPPHTGSKKCFVQNVDFGHGTAERCCDERFSCGSPECAHAHACKNPDVCFCRKRVCRKVYIKFSYSEKVDEACSKHLVHHF